MATISTERLIETIRRVNFNPSEIHRLFLKATEELTNGGVTFFDASNPTILAIEAGIITPAAVLREIQTITRRLYAPAVDDWDSLFLHMQDDDNHDLAAQPGTCTAIIVMSVEELKRNAVPIKGDSGIRVIEFPAHTQIVVNEIGLMLKRPISIRINKHDNISIKYNLTNDSVFGPIRSAIIDFDYTYEGDMQVVRIPVECVQTKMSSQVVSLSPSSGFKQRFNLTDKFYKIKAFTRLSNDQWAEIDVTHRMKVLNKNKTTVQVTATDDRLTVELPYFYFNNGMVGTDIRLDIYTTKGAIEHPLTNYGEGSYAIRYFDYNNRNNEYAGVLGSMRVLKCYSVDTITGGRNGLSFDEIKNKVINRSTISEGLPITEKEIANRLKDYGFTTVKIKDNLTERLYAATRLLPPPNELTVTGVGCNVQMLQTTVDKLTKLSTVRSNGNRLTILPTTLYSVDNGMLNVVDSAIVNQMVDPNVTAPENLAAWANANDLVFSPYYYVHDMANNEYKVRSYRLDKPEVLSKVTVNENPTLQLDAGVYNYQIIKDVDGLGYRLFLGLNVGENFKEINPNNISLQLSYLDETGENRYYLNGTLATPTDPDTGYPVDYNYIYRFDFYTNWDIDEDHRLLLANGQLPLPLDVDLDVFIIVKDFSPEGFSKTVMDQITSISTLENFDGRSTQYALIQERLSISFGKYMEELWHRSRTIIDDSDFKRYTENVPAVYTDDVIKTINGVYDMQYDPISGDLVYTYLHRKGDPIYDPESGLPIYKHKVNSIVMEFGQPVYKEGLRGLKRQFDLVVMDGLYYLTTHEDTIAYTNAVLDTIDSWVFNILRDKIKPELLERTTALFHPKSTVGLIEVFVENGLKVLVKSDQAFFVRFFVTSTVFDNKDLRTTIERTAKLAIQDVLSTKTTISQTDLTSALKDAIGENVLGISVSGFMNNEYNTITVVDGLTTPSIGKRLSVNSKLELVIEDAVEFEFIDHTRRQLR